ncbi:hypothetical protein BGZ74_000788 [Mortierella antarctica]|nr:hypothetical protein BGZ74_000788 [Mortierella antarctica]
MSIAAYLQTELVALSNEARRKHPEIKEVAITSHISCRGLGLQLSNHFYVLDNSDVSFCSISFCNRQPSESSHCYAILVKDKARILRMNQDVLKPFLLACDTKNAKLVTISMGCLRELISHRAMPEGAIEVVLKTLNDIMSQGVEIQLKILQTILPLLTNYDVHGESLAEDSRVVFVNNTAAATLRQLVIYIFEKVGEEDIRIAKRNAESAPAVQAKEAHDSTAEQENEEQLGPCALDAYLLFQDLCLLTNSEHARFLRLGSISRTFGLELVESVLTNHFHLFKQARFNSASIKSVKSTTPTHKEFASLLRERVCPLIIKNFSDKHDFPQTMRLMRVVYILIKQFHEILAIECEIFLSMLIKLLEPEGNILWQRVLAMEIFRGICGDNALMRRIYKSYDQQGTSTDIFGDLIIAIGRLSTEKPLLIGAGSFIQDSSEVTKQSHVNEREVTEGAGGLSVTSSTMRIQCVDQLDKADPPQIPETYLYYLSLICINSIADGLASYIFPIVSQALHDQQRQAAEQKEGEASDSAASRAVISVFPNTNTLELSKTKEADEIALVTTMAESAWPGLLAAFSYFLGSNLDEELFHNVMRAYQNFTSVCGVLQLTTPRDAFLTSLCKNCLPTLPALDQRSSSNTGNTATQETSTPNITEKNIYCLRILLNVAQYLGGTLFDSCLASGSSHQEADVLALLASFKQLFDLSTHLDLSSFQSFTRALCKLGAAGSGLPIADGKGSTSAPFLKGLRHVNKSDDKSFAIEKLRYVCLQNVDRTTTKENGATVWDISVGYLIETANHPTPSVRIRMQACDAISDIIIAAMAHAEQNSLARQEETQMRVMNNLRELIQSHGHVLVEIQRMGLETLNKLLQTSGQSLSFGWGLIFEMIQSSIGTPGRPNTELSPDTGSGGDLTVASPPTKSTGLVRIAFPCLQLICTDFLSLLNATNLQLCIDTLAAFGYQTEDLNISLTSVGLLWNISDFIQQSLRDLTPSAVSDASDNGASGSRVVEDIVQLFPDSELSHSNLNGLWMLLLYKISTLCSDMRPEVRNGAIQTLLRTIQINAMGLDMRAWQQCIWKILLPLLDDVDEASSRKVEEAPEPANTGSFVMRHDSPSKQWDETHVLLFNGLADVFQNFLLKLIRLDDYLDAWVFLMEHFESASLFSSPEVAIAALKGIQTMMKVPAAKEDGKDQLPTEREERLARLWDTAWAVWERIGSAIIGRDPVIGIKRKNLAPRSGREMTTRFTQETLTEYVNIMHHLYPILAAKFELRDLQAFLSVINQVLIFESSPVYRPDVDYLSPLQLAIHDALMMLNLSTIPGGPAAVLGQLTSQFLLALHSEAAAQVNNTPAPGPPPPVRPTYIALCKVTVTRIVFLLDKFQKENDIYSTGIYAKILKAFGTAMRLRYKCPPSFKHVEDIPLWKIATTAFLECIKNGILIVEGFESEISDQRFLEIWQELVVVCRGTMAPSLPIPLTEMSLKNQALDESFDLVFLHSLKTKVFFRMGYHRVPLDILGDLVQILDHAANLYVMSTAPLATAQSPSSHGSASNNSLNGSGAKGSNKPSAPEAKGMVSSESGDPSYDIIQGLGITLHSTTNTMVPVGRERFAFGCLEILFDLCSNQGPVASSTSGTSNGTCGNSNSSSNNNNTSEADIRFRTAKAATPILMQRCQALLEAYSADQTLLGKCPFPRLRHQEISLILQRMNDLRLLPGVMVDKSSSTHIPAGGKEEEAFVKHSVLAGPTGHLFYLYEPLTEAMFCHDPEVLLLLKACLRTAGRSFGLNK